MFALANSVGEVLPPEVPSGGGVLRTHAYHSCANPCVRNGICLFKGEAYGSIEKANVKLRAAGRCRTEVLALNASSDSTVRRLADKLRQQAKSAISQRVFYH